MKVGVSSYCYHRYFGEVYEGLQKNVREKMTIEGFIERAARHKAEGISIEESYLQSHDTSYLKGLKEKLDGLKMYRIYSWGYPSGLEGGRNEKAYDDMLKHIEFAQALGADVMRVIGSSDMIKDEPRARQVERLSEMFSKAVKVSRGANVKLSQANHSDFSPAELLQIAHNVNSPFFGINFVTGNFFRIHSDPVESMEKLAKFVFAVDVKDLKPQRFESLSSWHFYASTPLGDGLVDNKKIVKFLKDAGFKGLMSVEIDYLHPDYRMDEDKVVAKSIRYLKEIRNQVA